MNPISKRHHYIPQFFINGFTNQNDSVAVYDTIRKQFWKRNASPKQIFFEWNRNLFEINGLKTDFVETLYSKIDTDFSIIYNDIKKQKNPKLDILQWFHLILFIGITYWRIPKTDNDIKSFIKHTPKELLFFEVLNKKTNKPAPSEIFNRIVNEDAFIETYRMIKPLFDWVIGDPASDMDNWKIYYSQNDNELHLLSDNPIILKNDSVKNIFENELIFPLTKGKKIHHNFGKKITFIAPEHSVKVDIMLLLQTKQYICGPNRNYLNAIVNLAEQYDTEKKIIKLKKEIFEIFN